MAEDKNVRIAQSVLEHVGGAENISTALHCMTRLRLVLKDDGLADKEALKEIPGVLGVVEQGGQLQIVIGQNVPKVHAAVVAAGVQSGGSVDEAPDAAPKTFEWTPKNVGNAILGYLSGSMVPMIPVLMAAGLFKTLSTIIAPGMLGLVAEGSNVLTLLDFLYDAGFYFLPIYLGYNAASRIGATPMLGAYLGGILIAPAFVALANAGEPFSVFGIPCTPGVYSSTVVPILLSVWVLSIVERFVKKIMPDALTTIFTPFLTMLIMVPVTLCALAPLGNIIGNGLAGILYALGTSGGIVSIIGAGIVAALWTPLVVTGMHVGIGMLAIASFFATGADFFVLVAAAVSNWSGFGSEIGTFLRLKNKEEKSLAAGYVISNMIGGVGEPFIYGILFRYPRVWITNGIGAFVGAAVASALGVGIFTMTGASNVLAFLNFTGGSDPSNVTKAAIACAIAFVISIVATYLFGFTQEELEGKTK